MRLGLLVVVVQAIDWRVRAAVGDITLATYKLSSLHKFSASVKSKVLSGQKGAQL
jgi:hypothetical protein